MNPDQIRAGIRTNLEGKGASEVKVDLDAFGSVRIIVVSSAFEGMSLGDRRGVVLAGLESSRVEWLELLTPAEREWAGSLPNDENADELPLWPQALAREEKGKRVFPLLC
jgi:hypothetical protein